MKDSYKITSPGLYYVDVGSITKVSSEEIFQYFREILFSNYNFINNNIELKNCFNLDYVIEGGQLDLEEKMFLFNFIKLIKPKKLLEFSSADRAFNNIDG